MSDVFEGLKRNIKQEKPDDFLAKTGSYREGFNDALSRALALVDEAEAKVISKERLRRLLQKRPEKRQAQGTEYFAVDVDEFFELLERETK